MNWTNIISWQITTFFYQKHIHYFCKKNILKLKKHEFDFIPNKTFICTSGKCNDEVSLENSKWCRDIFFFHGKFANFLIFFEGWAWVNFTQCRRFHLGFASMNIFGSISFFFSSLQTKAKECQCDIRRNFYFFLGEFHVRFIKVEYFV